MKHVRFDLSKNKVYIFHNYYPSNKYIKKKNNRLYIISIFILLLILLFIMKLLLKF